ncbi:outer membrane beta-barrel protein [Nonlabens marinus]|uniref:TonB-dependent receptor n=1 Tax=Nonlabens marinus S1-08 TaxID=1454201 RepID=W8VU80_9FLAO|nr:outer membrane beta-barrel protein [Nonlabens marinus]BAO54368.1 TonB-dependent receptor [Nonlabens marinus S1-08]
MNKFVIAALLLGSLFVHSQQFTITGTVTDSVTKQKLLSATVFLESVEDSTLITYSITDIDGKFNLTGNTNYELLNFYTSFQGYQEITRVLDLSKNRQIDMGNIMLSNDIESLGDVVVTARKAPITLKQDTLEFNAKSFNTKADATLEDVIKELPGVELDKDGNITVNGKQVTKILVNGKEFFGDDPQIALKNLPKEIIDKIQVTESKTEEQKQSGDAGDDNASEINITIDEDKNKGWFSRLTAGAGTDDRYSMSGIANYFKDELRVSVLGSSNNINSPGFSFDEIYDAMGSSAYSISRSSNGSFGINGVNFGSNSGITSSRSAGFNYSDEYGEKVEADANYFYGRSDNISATDSRRTTFLPDRTFTTTSSNNSNSLGNNHRFGSRITVKPDTLTSIYFRPRATLSDNSSNSNQFSASRDEDGNLINDVTTTSNNISDNRNLGANLYVSRRLKTKGSFISLSADFSEDQNNSDNRFNSERNTFNNNTTTTDIQNQLINQNTRNTTYSFGPRYRQALDSNWRASVEYNYQHRDQSSERNVFDIDPNSGNRDFNTTLSNDFDVISTQQRPEVGVSYEKGEFRMELGTGYIFQTLESEDVLQQVSFSKDFNNLFLQANLRQKIGKFGQVYLYYNNSVDVPSVRELQPVEDRTNPTNIVVGNPDLDATIRHNVNLNWSNYDWEKGSGFYMGGNMSFNKDAVAAITTTDDDLIRTTTYTNVDGNRNGYLYSSFSKTWKKDKRDIGGDISINANYNRFVSFTNGIQFASESLGITPGASFEYSIRDLFEIELDYSLNLNSTAYDIASIEDQSFTNHTAAIDLTTFWPENLTMGLRGEYNRFGNVSSEFDNDSFVLIGSLGYKFAKDKAILKVTAYDLLDQVIATRRNVNQDFVLDTSSLVLQQYFMLSFTYKLSKFGGSDPDNNKTKFF